MRAKSGMGSEAGTVVLGPGWRGTGGLVFRSPNDLFVARHEEEVRPALAAACSAAEAGRYVAGFVAYEAAPAFDASYAVHAADGPLVWLAAYDGPASCAPIAAPCPPPTEARFAYDAAAYESAFDVLRGHIREGDVYQINFTGPLDFTIEGDPYSLYASLTARQPVPYAAFVDAGEQQVLSCSPELFFERRGDRIASRPMKGTVRRGRVPGEDERLERWLRSDAKSRAENLMIVDLVRNDLSKCCEPGSVHVTELFTTERYRTVFQMTSEVQGRLRPGAETPDVFAALFPCGSVTGAPKFRAMELIRRYEPEPRGIYCGAVGYMHDDLALFSVPIRTVTVRGERGRLGIGSGIVWDSEAEAEYEECLLKARFLTGETRSGRRYAGAQAAADQRAASDEKAASDQRAASDEKAAAGKRAASDEQSAAGKRAMSGRSAPGRGTEAGDEALRLIETMRSIDGTIPLLERHVERLRRSAEALGYRLDEEDVLRQVASAAAAAGERKIRLALDAAGRIQLTGTALEPSPSVWRVRLADTCIDAGDVFRRHKTTRRTPYDAAYEAARREGYDEVIFLNERGEVAEGTRSNVVVFLDAGWLTPPVRCGALPGVYRRFLLETRPEIDEAALTPQDLERADAVFLCNAVRGLVRARIEGAP